MTTWIADYIAALPNHLRPHHEDTRLKAATLAAELNGWTSRQAAAVIAARNYQGKTNPVLIAIIELEALAQHPPQRSHDEPRQASCQQCEHGWIDQPDNTHTTSPCPDCRPELTARINRIPHPGRRTHADIAYIRNNRTAN